jgi:hypothetical protein
VASVIIGATSLKQLEENMAVSSAQWKLSDEQVCIPSINKHSKYNIHAYYLEVNLLLFLFFKMQPFYERSPQI